MLRQLPIFDDVWFSHPARSGDPQTSHDAALSAKHLLARHYRLILGALTSSPANKDRIAARTSLTGVQVGRRLGELERLGQVETSGELVPSTSGRSERVWRLVRSGK